MSSRKPTQASDGRVPWRLEGWKVAISIGVAIVLAPVIGLVFLVLLVAVLPTLPFLVTLWVGVSWSGEASAVPLDGDEVAQLLDGQGR
jgi:hypothetical protein